MFRRIAATGVAGALAGVLAAACGGSSNSPTPVNQQPPNATPPSAGTSVNLAPVIEALVVSAERVEVDAEVKLTADVKDSETPIDQLLFEWKTDAGTFSGEGPTVTWRAPKDVTTPADYAITLTVTERYGTPDGAGVRPQNVATAAAPRIRVHNSPRELGDLALQFLSDFANSETDASACIRNFSDSCRGKAEERADIQYNRDHYKILSSSLNLKRVSIGSSGLNGQAMVGCSFRSRITKCPPPGPGVPACTTGSVESVQGDCVVTGVYEQQRWWLCDSRFENGVILPSMRGFFGIR